MGCKILKASNHTTGETRQSRGRLRALRRPVKDADPELQHRVTSAQGNASPHSRQIDADLGSPADHWSRGAIHRFIGITRPTDRRTTRTESRSICASVIALCLLNTSSSGRLKMCASIISPMTSYPRRATR